MDIKDATESIQKYWNTYDAQLGYESYNDKTFLDDALYAIGIAIDKDKFQFASGYNAFKNELRKHLGQEIER